VKLLASVGRTGPAVTHTCSGIHSALYNEVHYHWSKDDIEGVFYVNDSSTADACDSDPSGARHAMSSKAAEDAWAFARKLSSRLQGLLLRPIPLLQYKFTPECHDARVVASRWAANTETHRKSPLAMPPALATTAVARHASYLRPRGEKLTSVRRAHCATFLSIGMDGDPRTLALPRLRRPSNVSLTIHFGYIKTGTTSLNKVMSAAGTKACKWAISSIDLAELATFASDAEPTIFRRVLFECEFFTDNPWWAMPSLMMPILPRNTKFILTRYQAGCEEWVYRVQGLWHSHRDGANFETARMFMYADFHRCIYGSNVLDNATQALFVDRCIAHERAVVKSARALGRPLLIIANEWTSEEKWAALQLHMGWSDEELGRLHHTLGSAKYPRVRTGSVHLPTDPPRPTAPKDPNRDLFSGVTPAHPILV